MVKNECIFNNTSSITLVATQYFQTLFRVKIYEWYYLQKAHFNANALPKQYFPAYRSKLAYKPEVAKVYTFFTYSGKKNSIF